MYCSRRSCWSGRRCCKWATALVIIFYFNQYIILINLYTFYLIWFYWLCIVESTDMPNHLIQLNYISRLFHSIKSIESIKLIYNNLSNRTRCCDISDLADLIQQIFWFNLFKLVCLTDATQLADSAFCWINWFRLIE